MPDITAIAGKAAGIITLVALIPYVIAILRKETKPNRATWWIWLVVGLMIGISYYSSGAKHTIWVPVTYVIGPLIIVALSFKYGEGGWTWFDRSCLLVAGISAVLWWMFKTPLIALLINLFIDFLGALPTIRKSYSEPKGEDRTAWTLFFAGNVVNLFAVETWTFSIAVYPIYMLLLTGTIAGLLFLRPRKRMGANAQN